MSKRVTFRFFFLWMVLVALVTGCSLPNAAGEATPTISGAPVVQLASPLPNATYLKEVTVNIQALVSNAGDGIDRAEISVDNTVIATVPSPNPSKAPAFSVTQTWPATAAGSHTISVIVYRTDGTASEPATVTITVLDELPEVAGNDVEPTRETTDDNGSGDDATTVASQPTNTTAPTRQAAANATATTAPTNTTEPTAAPTQATRPVIKTRPGGLNVRKGPSANFVPALGVLAGDQTVEVLAYNPNGVNPPGIWYKIPFGGGEGWIFSGLVDFEGDLNQVPVETGPAIPTLAPPTSAPATAAPTTAGGGTTTGVNLVLTVVEFRLVTPGATDGNNIFKGEAAFARVNVTNNGTQATPVGVFVAVAIADNGNPNGSPVFAESPSATGIIAPGQTVTVDVPFTDNTQAGANRRAVIIVDSKNQVSESNEGDNNVVKDYTLGAR